MNSHAKATRQLLVLCGAPDGHEGNVPHIHATPNMITVGTAQPELRPPEGCGSLAEGANDQEANRPEAGQLVPLLASHAV